MSKSTVPTSIPVTRLPMRELPFEGIQSQVSFLEGEVLTIADASYSDRQQREAVKDLIRKSFRNRIDYFYQLCADQGPGNASIAAKK